MFSNGSQTSMTLEFDHQLTDEQIENLREQFADNYAGWRNAHKPLILESGMKANAIGMPAPINRMIIDSRKARAKYHSITLLLLLHRCA
jgi:phage portal protein BeeE